MEILHYSRQHRQQLLHCNYCMFWMPGKHGGPVLMWEAAIKLDTQVQSVDQSRDS